MKKILYCSLLLALLSCGNKQETSTSEEQKTPAFDIAAVKNHIDTMNKVYGDRFYKNDINWYKERYCTDASALPDKWKRIDGVDSLMSYYYNGGTNKEIQIIITATNVYGSADLVVEEGTYSFPDGQGGSFDSGKFMALWKQQDGQWKMYREIWNSDTAPETIVPQAVEEKKK